MSPPFVRRGYRLIEATPARPLLRSRFVQRLKTRLITIPGQLVPQILDELDHARVLAWLMGGWGIDALVGEQTRRHTDLDIAFDAAGETERQAFEALAPIGFEPIHREPAPSWWWSERIPLSDEHGRIIDLHPVRVSPAGVELEPPGGPLLVAQADAFTHGSIAGRRVPCLSPALQLELHRSYVPTETDRRDVERLCERFGLRAPVEYGRAPDG